MNLEDRIKELQKKLDLKKAYENVQISFKNNKFPKEVTKEVEESVKTFCEMMSEKIDKNHEEPSPVQESKTTSKLSEVKKSNEEAQKKEPLKATLMTTDNLPLEMRKLITSMSEVQVVNMNDEKASIQFETKQGIKRTAVPVEDLQVN